MLCTSHYVTRQEHSSHAGYTLMVFRIWGILIKWNCDFFHMLCDSSHIEFQIIGRRELQVNICRYVIGLLATVTFTSLKPINNNITLYQTLHWANRTQLQLQYYQWIETINQQHHDTFTKQPHKENELAITTKQYLKNLIPMNSTRGDSSSHRTTRTQRLASLAALLHQLIDLHIEIRQSAVVGCIRHIGTGKLSFHKYVSLHRRNRKVMLM